MTLALEPWFSVNGLHELDGPRKDAGSDLVILSGIAFRSQCFNQLSSFSS